MSEVIVGKGGGTSNADAAAVEQSLDWAEQSDLFVVSAPGRLDGSDMIHGKVTDMLLEARASYAAMGRVSGHLIEAITERYGAIVDGLGGSSLAEEWVGKISGRVEAAAQHGEDAASMLGERLQAEIYESMGFTLLDPGRAPHELGSDPAAWRGWLSHAVRDGEKYVLPGNTTLAHGHLMTFSRGGSDTSGGLAAYGVRADLHRNLTDHGAKSANPAYIDEARLVDISHMLYEEGRELGRNGTGLLHPAAMVPLMIGGIPTEIRSTFDRQAPVTLLDNDTERAARRAGSVLAVSLMEDVTIHRVREPGMAEAVGRLAAFEGALAEAGIALVDAQGDGVDGQKYFIASDISNQAHRILKDLARTAGGAAETSDNLHLLTLVGYDLETKLLDNIRGLVQSSGIDSQAWQARSHDISTGRHSLRISASPKEAPGLLDGIHAAFIERS
jgi:aspartate kinase